MSERRLNALVIGALFLVITSLFFDVLFLGTCFYRRDILEFHHPTKFIVREIIRAGQFPFWNHSYAGGQPLAANPNYGVFYPPQWITWIGDYDAGFRLHIMLHYYIGAAGMYLLLRTLRLRWETAALGGLTFVMSGYWQSLTGLLPYLFSLTWLPWILLFFHRYLERRKPGDFAAGALALGMVAIIGEPSSILQAGALVAAYAIYRAFHTRGDPQARARDLGAAVLLIACSCAVALVQLAPAAQLAADSVRSRGFDYSHVVTWSMHPARLVELLFPNVWGHATDQPFSFWARRFYPGVRSPFVLSIYFGLLSSVMVLTALFVQRSARLIVGACAIAWIVAAGGNTPMFQVAYDLGIVRSIRFPEKFVIVSLFVLIIVGAKAFDRIFSGEQRIAHIGSAIAAVIAVVALSCGITASFDDYPAWFGRFFHLPAGVIAQAAATSRADWFIAFARAGGLAAILFFSGRSTTPARRRLCLTAAFAFVLLDLGPLANEIAPRITPQYFQEPSVARTLDPRRSSYRIFSEAASNARSEDARRYHSSPELSYWVERNGMWPLIPTRWGFFTVLDGDYDRTYLLPTTDLVEAMHAVQTRGVPWWRATFMAMSGARYATRYRPFPEEISRVRGDLTHLQPVDFVDVMRAGRYYFADRFVQIGGTDDFVQRIRSRPWGPFAAFVTLPGSYEPAPGAVTAVRESANAISLRVSASGRAFLVLAVTRHRNWRATIDGRPATLLPANIAYQGLEIPPGSHDVTLSYSDPIILATAPISLASILALLAVFIRGFRARHFV